MSIAPPAQQHSYPRVRRPLLTLLTLLALLALLAHCPCQRCSHTRRAMATQALAAGPPSTQHQVAHSQYH